MRKRRKATPLTVLAGFALMAVAPSQAAQISGFNDFYDVSNWTQVTEGNGSINLANAPTSIVLTSANDFSGLSQNVDFTIEVAGDGHISFSFFYITEDSQAFWDPFGYLLNGNFFELAGGSGTVISGITLGISVVAGDIFGFRQGSVDSGFGAATTTISNFSAPGVSAVPEPASLALLGLGLAGLGFMRRRRV